MHRQGIFSGSQVSLLPQPQRQELVPWVVLQQGLQQALATKSGNRMPWVVVYRPQELQVLQELQLLQVLQVLPQLHELQAIKVPPLRNDLEAGHRASRSSYAGVSKAVTASRPGP